LNVSPNITERATSSLEVDILPITDDNDTTIELADLVVGVAGELAPFEQLHGFSIDGVDLTTAALPMAGETASSKCRTPTPPTPPVTPNSSAGAWTKKTSVWPNCARSG
jgi:hypothetical protein